MSFKPSICYIARSDFISKPGGDTVQWQMYEKTALSAGYTTLSWFEDSPLPEADLYHAFNIDRPLEVYPKLRTVRNSGKPFVLSTIHHPYAWMQRFRREFPPGRFARRLLYRSQFGNSFPRAESIKEIARLAQQRRFAKWHHLFPAWTSRVNWILRAAGGITLLSGKEGEFLEKDFGYQIPCGKAMIVPNWVEGIPNSKTDSSFGKSEAAEPPVILVGRVETRKNLVRVAMIAEKMGRPMVIIGRPNPNEDEYSSELRRVVKKSRYVKWIPGVPREQMARLYAKASFLLNASYAEVSPLVDIEAMSFGCPVATTRYALHHEFLPENTPVCDAYNDSSISELLSWRPPRMNPTFVVDAEECRKKLLSIYARLSERRAA
jgi:glycosyltransferase involved in cell wall biosynthesis